MSLYDDLYTFLLDGGDSDILEEARQRAKEDMRRKDILEKHPYKITEIAENGRPSRFQTYILVDGKRKLIRKTQKKDLEDYLIKFYDSDISKNSLEKVYAEWIRMRDLTRTSSTVKKDIWVWDTYYKGTDFAKADISILKAPTITSYLLEKVRSMGLTQRKFREMKSLLNAVLDYAVQMDYISHNPSREIHGISMDVFTPKEEYKRQKRVLSDSEKADIFKESLKRYTDHGNPVYLAIAMNMTLGLRVGELAALQKNDFDFSTNTLTVQRSEQTKLTDKDGKMVREAAVVVPHLKKGHASRTIPLTSLSRRLYSMSDSSSEWLFARSDGQRVTTNAINQAYRRLCGYFGIEALGNHAIRRTVITNMIESLEFTQKEIQDFAGHNDYKTTNDYYDYAQIDYQKSRSRMDRALGVDGIQL